MTLRVIHIFDCDGCGQEIEPGAVLPVTLLDEERREVHFHDHRCLIPYAERRHAERLAAVRAHLAGNVEQIRANLAEAEANAAAPQASHALAREQMAEQLAHHEARAADLDAPDDERAQSRAAAEDLRSGLAAHAALLPDPDPEWARQADTIRPFLPEAEAALAEHDAEYGAG